MTDGGDRIAGKSKGMWSKYLCWALIIFLSLFIYVGVVIALDGNLRVSGPIENQLRALEEKEAQRSWLVRFLRKYVIGSE